MLNVERLSTSNSFRSFEPIIDGYPVRFVRISLENLSCWKMSQMKFLTDADTVVEDALRGFKCTYPALFVDPRNRIVLRNQVSGWLGMANVGIDTIIELCTCRSRLIKFAWYLVVALDTNRFLWVSWRSQACVFQLSVGDCG